MFERAQVELDNFIFWLHPMLGGSAWFLALLLGTGVVYTLVLGLPQIFGLGAGWRELIGKGRSKGGEGDIKPRQALFSALSGTVGTGNIGGVAVAIFTGGPAALFWMWITAFFGMAIKLGEISLSHKYREHLSDGTMIGGPMYVIEKRLKFLKLGWPLAALFAVMTMFNALVTGNSIQISTMTDALQEGLGVPVWVTSVVLTTALAITVLGGVRAIAGLAEVLIPLMQVLYIGGCLVVIGTNLDNVLPSLGSILGSVFTGTAAAGGFLGASVSMALRVGVGRGLFSNEAGQGSSPIAHAASKEPSSMREASLGMMEPLIDTLIICTLTGLAVLSSGVWTQKYEQQLEKSSIYYFVGELDGAKAADVNNLRQFIGRQEHDLRRFSGTLRIVDGQHDAGQEISMLANRSLAEKVRYFDAQGQPFSGEVEIDQEGRLHGGEGFSIRGEVLLSSVQLTSKAFEASPLGAFGPALIAICLVLFAFTTATVWSYYGDRASAWCFGVRGVIPYRLLYIAVFAISAWVDGGVIWRLSDISIAVMALPNLLILLLLLGEVRGDYRTWRRK